MNTLEVAMPSAASRLTYSVRRRAALGLLLAFGLLAGFGPTASADPEVEKSVKDEEAATVAVCKKVEPAVVAVCMYGGQGVGSGVLIDPEGYALTNFHVVQPTGPVMQCGLADGVLYDAVLVGIDKVGDVALVKLLPKKAGTPFPFVKLGDSDAVRAGDWSLAMGNPFSLAMDFTPTATKGIVSGVNRYQPPEGKGLLEYTDCIQTEASVNPGNSGGPLFNMAGELIGINGRISFQARSRINSGVGYAISINQIKNFLGHFYAGLDTDHATLGAVVKTVEEEGNLNRLVIDQILDDDKDQSDAFRRGLREGDDLLQFAGRPLTSTNQYKNILGVFPKEWRLPLVYRRANERRETLVRLMSNQAAEREEQKSDGGAPKPKVEVKPKGKAPTDSPAAKLYKEKKGFANYYFNEERQNALLADHRKHGDFAAVAGTWSADGSYEMADRKGDLRVEVVEPKGGEVSPTVKLKMNVEYVLQPLGKDQEAGKSLEPLGSGGLIMALYHYRRLLTQGAKGFEGDFHHGGTEPVYPPALAPDGAVPKSALGKRVDADVLRTRHASVDCKWYFSKADHQLVAFETFVNRNEDPCEVYPSDFRAVDGRMLPHRLEVRRGDKRFAVLTIKKYETKAN